MKTEDVDYRDGALACKGFLAYDDKVSGKRPGVVVFPEAWGLGDHAMGRAKMLADMGYVALAADPYGNRLFSHDIEKLGPLFKDFEDHPPKMRARAMAAVNTLAAHPQVDTNRMAAIGYCMGGRAVLELARSGADLAGVVSFHGTLGTIMPAPKGGVKARVLVLTGSEDPFAPRADVTGLEDEMRAAGADWHVVTYGGTAHSFSDVTADGSIAPGIIYNRTTDTRSWAAMHTFLEESFAR